MSLTNVIILIIINLIVYALIAAQLMGWGFGQSNSDNSINKLWSVSLAVSITVSIGLVVLYVLTNDLLLQLGSLQNFVTAIWINITIIVIVVLIKLFPRLSFLSKFELGSTNQQVVAVFMALMITAVSASLGIFLVSQGIINNTSFLRMFYVVLAVDAIVLILLLIVWLFPRLPWPYYDKQFIRGQTNGWYKAISGLGIAILLLLTVIGGLLVSYGEDNLSDSDIVLEIDNNSVTDEIEKSSSTIPDESTAVVVLEFPTRTGTEIPTVTPTSANDNLQVTLRPTDFILQNPTVSLLSLPTSTKTPVPTEKLIFTPTLVPVYTNTSIPTQIVQSTEVVCQISVSGWLEYKVQPGDTLFALATQVGESVAEIANANCLADFVLKSGQVIFLPAFIGEDYTGIVINKVDVPPLIDGYLEDWRSVSLTANNVVYGYSSWNNIGDLSFNYGLTWDNNNLYIAVKVEDDVHVQTENGETIFKGDSVEILFDKVVSSNIVDSSLSSEDYQIGLSPGDFSIGLGKIQGYRWFPSDKSGLIVDVDIMSRKLEKGYVLEASLPWYVFDVVPVIGQEYGFVISISDNDSIGLASQETMVSNIEARKLSDPGTWGRIKLLW